MKLSKKQAFPFTDGKEVIFEEEGHKYLIGKKQYKGVTTWLKQFKPEFKSKENALAYAIKHNILDYNNEPDVESVIQEWEWKGEESLIRGNRIHKYFEDHFKKKIVHTDISLQFIKKLQSLPRLGDFLNPEKEDYNTHHILSEQVIYSKLMDMCGMIDLLMINKETKKCFLLDFKTNKAIDNKAFADKRMFSPFQFVPDCNYYHYKLQLSMYARILELNGHDIGGMALIHIDHDDEFHLHKLELDYLLFLRKKFQTPQNQKLI